jgi:hypothetical protein
VPDDCDAALWDCNGNGTPDDCDVADGPSDDCTNNGVPDECEPDCDANGLADSCDIAAGTDLDCNGNGVLDGCDIASGVSADANTNGVPDECDGQITTDLWDGFDLLPPFYTGTLLHGLDYIPSDAGGGDGLAWDNPALTAYIQSPGCDTIKAVKLEVDSGLLFPEAGYVASEPFRTVDGRLHCGAARYTMSFSVSVRNAIDDMYDWRFTVYDGKSHHRLAQIDFPSTRSNAVTTEERGRILIANPVGPRINTGIAIELAACYDFQIVLDTVSRAVRVYADGELQADFDRPLDPAALRLDYFQVHPYESRAFGPKVTTFWMDNVVLTLDGAALQDWPDCNANCVHDAHDVAFGLARDCNGNGNPDPCDIAAGQSPDCNGDGVPDECEELGFGHFNFDGVVDILDYAAFLGCYTGPGAGSVPESCVNGDFDCDGDVDLGDFRRFQQVFTGS